MTLTTVNTSFKRTSPGSVYFAPAPTADPGTATAASTVDGYYGLFYGAGGKAAKKVLTAGVLAFCDLTSAGMAVKIKPSTVEFESNTTGKRKINTGIESAEVEFTFYDLTPAKATELFGAQAADLIAVAASTGVAGRKIAILGPSTSNVSYTAMFRTPDPRFIGEYWHWIFPAGNIIGELDLKLGKNDKYEGKITMSLEGSPFLNNAQGFPAVAFTDAPDAAATA